MAGYDPQIDEYDPVKDDYLPILPILAYPLQIGGGRSGLALNSDLNTYSSAANEAVVAVGGGEIPYEAQEKQTLRIIAKTVMKGGICYIGFDDGKLWRPITTTKEGLCCWPTESILKVGSEYKFNIIDRHPLEIPYPHRWNDVLVSNQVTAVGDPSTDLFDDLVPYSFDTVKGVFHPGEIKFFKFIVEDEICPSAGIYKCKGSQLQVYSTPNQFGNMRKRLKIDDGIMKYDFPITALQYKQSFDDSEDVLVVLGLGRPFDGNWKFNPKRCYLLVVGII